MLDPVPIPIYLTGAGPWSEFFLPYEPQTVLQDVHREGNNPERRRISLMDDRSTSMIKKDKNGYKVVSEKGKNLGSGYKTRAAAAKRLRQVEYFKHKKG